MTQGPVPPSRPTCATRTPAATQRADLPAPDRLHRRTPRRPDDTPIQSRHHPDEHTQVVVFPEMAEGLDGLAESTTRRYSPTWTARPPIRASGTSSRGNSTWTSPATSPAWPQLDRIRGDWYQSTGAARTGQRSGPSPGPRSSPRRRGRGGRLASSTPQGSTASRFRTHHDLEQFTLLRWPTVQLKPAPDFL